LSEESLERILWKNASEFYQGIETWES